MRNAMDKALARTLTRGAFTSRAYDGMMRLTQSAKVSSKWYNVAAKTWDAN